MIRRHAHILRSPGGRLGFVRKRCLLSHGAPRKLLRWNLQSSDAMKKGPKNAALEHGIAKIRVVIVKLVNTAANSSVAAVEAIAFSSVSKLAGIEISSAREIPSLSSA